MHQSAVYFSQLSKKGPLKPFGIQHFKLHAKTLSKYIFLMKRQ